MLSKNSPGCGSCCDTGPCAMVCTSAFDACSHTAVAGATVALTQGATTTSCTTDALGRCCNGSESGAYSVTVTATGYVTKTVTGTAKCPPPPTPVSYGPRYPGTWADDSGIGTGVWTNPGNAASSNSVYATAPSQGNTPTHYLKGTASGSFAIPTGGDEAIYRVRVEVGAKANAASTDHDVRLVFGGTIQATSKAAGSALSTGSTANLSYAWTAPADLPTIAQANAGDLGLVFSAKSPGAGSAPTSAGPTYAGTGADDATSGSNAWSSPGNITANDGTSATATTATSVATHLAKGTNYGFAIPAGATITSIVLEVGVKASAGGVTTDSKAHLVIAGTPQTGVNKAVGTTLNTSTITAMSYTWTTGLPTVAQVNDAGFGGAWSAVSGNFPALTVSCDWMRITVNYTTLGDATISVDYGRIYVDTTRTTYEITVPLARDCAAATHIAPCCDPVPDPLNVTVPSSAGEWGTAAGTTVFVPYSGFGFGANVWRWGPVEVDLGGVTALGARCAVVMVQINFIDVCHNASSPLVKWGYKVAACSGAAPADLVPFANRTTTSWSGTASCPIAFTATRNPTEVFVVSE